MRNLAQTIYKATANRWTLRDDGPMSPQFVEAFTTQSCQDCGTKLTAASIFGNALTYDQASFQLKCLKCRSNGTINIKPTPHFNEWPDYWSFIIDASLRIKRQQVTWWQVFIGWQSQNYGITQCNYDQLYSIKLNNTGVDDIMYSDPFYQVFEYEEPISACFGEIRKLSRCGECGVSLSSFNKKPTFDVQRIGRCPSCLIPNSMQWNMREDVASLLSRIHKNHDT